MAPDGCSLDANMLQGGTVRLVVNDDGKGGRTAVECREDNNSDELTVKLSDCVIP